VAALAGVPARVVKRAREKLASLERQAHAAHPGKARQLDLFETPPPHPALDLLESIDPDAVSPREAQDLLFRLKGLLIG
jgi:DNA mismatch repair protein MutS